MNIPVWWFVFGFLTLPLWLYVLIFIIFFVGSLFEWLLSVIFGFWDWVIDCIIDF